MKKSDELKNKLEEIKNKAEKLEKAEEIKNAIQEIRDLKAQIELAEMQEREEAEQIENKISLKQAEEIKNKKTKIDIKNTFAKAIIGRNLTNEEETEIKNLVVEGEKTKGGVAVPQDIVTDIRAYQDSTRMWDIRPYITVEPVGTMSGSRPYATNQPQASGFAPVEEGKAIQAMYEPTFDDLKYLITKYAGYIPITNELLEDNTANIYQYIVKWLAENELNTYAYQVFNGTGTKSAQGLLTEIAKENGILKTRIELLKVAPTIDKFKSIFNVDLETVTGDNIVIFTNADGYQYLDTLKDEQGRYYMQPDPTKKSGNVFLGREIVKVPKKFLPTDTTNGIPFIIGDLRQLYELFDRQLMSIQSTNVGGDAWRNDTTELKGIFRFDGKIKPDCIQAIKVLYAKF